MNTFDTLYVDLLCPVQETCWLWWRSTLLEVKLCLKVEVILTFDTYHVNAFYQVKKTVAIS